MGTVTTVTVSENTAVGTILATFSAIDVELSQVVRYSILGSTHGTNGSVFGILETTGELYVAGLINFEARTSQG